jgi:hypothetical protein
MLRVFTDVISASTSILPVSSFAFSTAAVRAVQRLLSPSAAATASDSLLVGVMDIGAEEEAKGEEEMRVFAVGSIAGEVCH